MMAFQLDREDGKYAKYAKDAKDESRSGRPLIDHLDAQIPVCLKKTAVRVRPLVSKVVRCVS
jgi:hypothetical protein